MPAQDVQKLAEESKNYFQNDLGEFVYYRTYSRWMDDKGRRETWIESVDRFIDFMRENLGDKFSEEDYQGSRQMILEQKVVPSMRLMWSAGEAARATNVAAYNCSYIAPTQLRDFGEIMYVSMCGTGVGFSVEQKTVSQLPKVEKQKDEDKDSFVIDDSKEGWAEAFIYGLEAWFAGKDVEFDFSQLRPKGARLKTMGGRSSGPEPLKKLLEFSRNRILSRQGEQLSTLDVHDICCMIGEIVVAGGVRRSAMISLSDLNDEEMRYAKHGEFWNENPQRAMANNSAVYEVKPTREEFDTEWQALKESGTGERGIFNRAGLETQLPARRWEVFKDHLDTSGTNPCGEIILRSKQFCNLTSIVIRKEDDEKSLLEKVKWATVLGTYQSALTHFPFLSKDWQANCEEEALLGVSVTGVWDNPEVARNPELLRKLRDYSVEVNAEYAEKLGIQRSTCVTTVKPSGNSSQLLDTSSGLHPRNSKYYIRRIRISATDPLFQMLKDQNIPHEPEVGQTYEMASTYVLEFPVESPDSIYKNDQTAIEQLENWKLFKQNFTEHNPSVTISIGDDEWDEAADWIYDNWDIVGGLSFLPRSDHKYKLAPYEEIDKAKYEELAAKFPPVDYSKILEYEKQDETKGAKELACAAGGCDIV